MNFSLLLGMFSAYSAVFFCYVWHANSSLLVIRLTQSNVGYSILAFTTIAPFVQNPCASCYGVGCCRSLPAACSAHQRQHAAPAWWEQEEAWRSSSGWRCFDFSVWDCCTSSGKREHLIHLYIILIIQAPVLYVGKQFHQCHIVYKIKFYKVLRGKHSVT